MVKLPKFVENHPLPFITLALGALFLILGIYFLKKPNKYSQHVTATLSNVTCTSLLTKQVSGNYETQYTCNGTYNYTVNGNPYTSSYFYSGTTQPANGQTVSINIDPNNPTSTSTAPANKTTGIVLTVIGAVFALVFIISLYASIKKPSK